MSDQADIRAGRLPAAAYDANFSDVKPPLDPARAVIEANRCYFCYDAPCQEACPTGIDIPSFIKKIATDNLKGSARVILEDNIMGGTCARVCPVEILCEQACVRNTQESKPVKIGMLQRRATDWLMEHGDQPFERAEATGKRIAVVGGGPAGIACAHRLAVLGHEVVIYEARDKLGGLNEYGIAAYKLPDGFAQKEVDFILGIGGIEARTGQALGRDFTLSQLRGEYDAVFLGLGHAGVNLLGLEGDNWEGVQSAVSYIEMLRQADDLSKLPIGRRVVVIGGGNTAIDMAVQAKRLGAEDVTLVYRRGPEEMSATDHEQEFAQINGVRIRHWARPVRLIGRDGRVREVEFEYTQLDEEGRLMGTGDRFTLLADQLFTAIGQKFVPDPLRENEHEVLEIANGRIAVNDEGQTSLPDVWAGGDCTPGEDLTVAAVQDGKVAALSIDRYLSK